jgi:propanediol dehydratase large subunit
MTPVPILSGGTDESISARYQARAVALVAMERASCEPGEPPVTVRAMRA